MNQGNISEISPGIPAKRKRGRPRKDPTLRRLAIAPPPPGFQAPNGNQPRYVGPVEDSNNGLIGQSVTGVVEATFDAGYLLAVKIGNSNTSLRGVVFKPGHYTPVTAENDVAPHLQMIKRNEIHFHSGQTHGRSSYLVNNGSQPSNQVHRVAPPKGKYASAIVPAPSVPPVGARGTVVPVVLQPVHLSNGVNPVMSALKGKHVQTVTPLSTYPPNGTSPQVTPPSLKSENGPYSQGKPEFRQGESANKGVEGSSQSSDTQVDERDGGSDTSEPLFIEPLQTVHTHHPYNLSASMPRTVDSNRTGRMTELLMAVQENMPENHFPRVELPVSGTNINFQQPRST